MLGPTASLLWAACRLRPEPDEVAAAVAGGADLELAADQAVAQRVSPLLWRALEAAGVDTDGAAWADELRRDTARCRAHALLVFPRIGDAILRPLADAGHQPLALKGAVLAGRYPAPGLRPMDDIDLLLPPSQHPSALAALRDAGWRELPPLPHAHHEVVLSHPGLPGLPLELHHDISTWQDRSNRLTADDLWRRRVPCTIDGAPAFGLTPEDEIVAVAAHAAKPYHTFRRLLWIVDLAAIVEAAAAAGTPVDWDEVARRADATACRTAVAVGLTQATRIGLDSPPDLRRPQATGVRLAALEPVLSLEWPAATHDWPTRHRLRYALVDDKGYRLRMFIGAATEPGLAGAPSRAMGNAVRAVKRWLRLQRSAGGAAGRREDSEQSLKP